MGKTLEKSYSPNIEKRIYQTWLDNNYFKAEDGDSKPPYTIVIPPPNVTGQLHLGHAFNNALQDALIRWKRMKGFNALWLPGTDHAAIATEVRIVNKMKEEGLTKDGIGREAFLERAWDWKRQYGGRIIEQLKTMGFSCDWSRERFTMDEGLNRAVTEVFCRLYEKGLIYRGERLVNWCAKCRTSISDAEVEHEEKEGRLWYFKYPIADSEGFLEFATTRPETMLGDTAIAVHPEDARYKHLAGKSAVVPIVNREIPIIADKYVDPAFGAGVVKITPGHDPNDYEVGLRHGLPIINILNDDGTINANGGPYAGIGKEDARVRIIDEFKAMGLYVKEEKITHSVGTHDRCRETAEPVMKLQWFVKMAPLAEPAVKAYKNGELRIFPDRLGKVYLGWLENIKDWCVSRQLWWGHRIPAWYCGCGETAVARRAPEKCPKCGALNMKQDEDVLDTWFSSALWPFSTLGWPDETPDMKRFYPTDALVTSYDIIFFWVARMVFSGLEHTGKLPFKDVLFNGLIRDANGKKMSKSSGNGVDPLEAAEQSGSDALRFALLTGSALGGDQRFHPEKIEASRNFLNKLWNAARFIIMNLDGSENPENMTSADKWILSRVNKLAREAGRLMGEYELGLAAQIVSDFIWDEFCDWYIEFVKPRLYGEGDKTRPAALHTLKTALTSALKLLHPFLPFITEEIYQALNGGGGTIMYAAWPEYRKDDDFPAEEAEIERVKETVKAIRALRAEKGVSPKKKPRVTFVSASEEGRRLFRESAGYIKNLAGASEIAVQADAVGIEEDAACVVVSSGKVFIPLAELLDADGERERLTREKNRLESEAARAAQKLSNPGFVSKAPEKVLALEREKAGKYKEMLESVFRELEKLS